MIRHVRGLLVTLSLTLAVAWGVTHAAAQPTRTLDVTLDWLPSPEYYGFYYAAYTRLYEKVGVRVTFKNASGAPVVAAQLAAGSIRIGTSTSDALLRQAAQGASYQRLVPLILFNPVSLVSLPRKPVRAVADIRNATIGTNPQSSAYAQFEHLLRTTGLPFGSFKEFPIGYGGSVQLLSGQVDAFLAYTTNQAIDIELQTAGFSEFLFEDQGIKNYGLVLAVAEKGLKVDPKLLDDFISATIQGYKLGGANVEDAAIALLRAEPTLNKDKTVAAIRKIVRLNERASETVPPDLDAWVNVSETSGSSVRKKLRSALQLGLQAVRSK